MPRDTRVPVLLAVVLAVLAFGLTACGGDDDIPFESTPDSDATQSAVPTGDPSSAPKSCQAIIGSGAVEDIQAVFDKYKDNSKAFTPADEQEMRNALDRLAKAGDDATPKIREAVVTLVADVGSQIDSREGLPGTGQVASNASIVRQLDALCR
jgi:hypothetical protein